MLKNKDIIIIGLQPWYTDIGSNCKNIALQLSRYNRVLYVNIPLNRITLLKERSNPVLSSHKAVIAGKANPVQRISKNLWQLFPKHIHESINWVPSTKVFALLCRMNDRRLASDIEEGASFLGFKDYVLFNDNDIFRGLFLKDMLKPKLYIYYCRDFLTSSGYYRKHGRILEPQHIACADLAVSNSYYLTKYLKKHNPNSHYIGQGCNIEVFDGNKQFHTPSDLKRAGRPIIGYVGTLTGRRLDIDMIYSIAAARPQWDIVLVGPEDLEFQSSRLHEMPNIIFLGKKDMNQLPAYIQSFDVCINPQLVNELTIGNYPLKIDEYLSMGKPVVATKTDAMSMFEEHCHLAESAPDYIAMIGKAIYNESVELKAQRMDFARQHTWENSVKKLCFYIQSTLGVQDPLLYNLNMHSFN